LFSFTGPQPILAMVVAVEVAMVVTVGVAAVVAQEVEMVQVMGILPPQQFPNATRQSAIKFSPQ
jgi:hypothetical protein